MYSIVVRQSYTLQSGPPVISSTHLAPYIVITILLTTFPMREFTSLWLFCDCHFGLLNPFPFFTQPLNPSLLVIISLFFVSLSLFLFSTSILCCLLLSSQTSPTVKKNEKNLFFVCPTVAAAFPCRRKCSLMLLNMHLSSEAREVCDQRTFPWKQCLTETAGPTQLILEQQGWRGAATGATPEGIIHKQTGSEKENSSCFQKSEEMDWVGSIYSFHKQ